MVELLTVLAVIGVLAAIVVPVARHSRARTLQAQCISNLRQIGIGIQLYTQDQRGAFPTTTHNDVTGSQSWVFSVAPYLGDVDEVRVCPLDAKVERVKTERLTSFALNDWLTPEIGAFGISNLRFSRTHLLPNPARTFIAFCRNDSLDPTLSQDHTHSTLWTRWNRVTSDIDPDRFRSPSQSRHPQKLNGSAPYLFGDGSVKTIRAQDLSNHLAAGVNFSKPGIY